MGGENQGPLRRLAFVSSIGISMVLATFIGLYIGIWLDDFFSTTPWLTIIFLLFGIAAGFRNIYVLIKKYDG